MSIMINDGVVNVNVTVIALKQFSTGEISMFKGEIREFDAETAETLIDNGLVEKYVPDVPEVGTNDKDKYLHTNAETGAKEWANVSSGGGVLVVNVSFTYDDVEETWSFTTDKTFAEIVAADTAGQKILAYCTERGYVGTPTWLYVYREDDYTVVNGVTDISAGAVGAYYELSFSMDADENAVDVAYWQKGQE